MKKIILTALIAGIFASTAQAVPSNNVSKKITLTAQINDSLFVSKPDGSTWYTTEELDAEDYKQQKFSKTLPVRVWSKNDSFKVSLAQPLMMTNSGTAMENGMVTWNSAAGAKALTTAQAETVTQVSGDATNGYDNIYDLTINVDAPQTPINGTYTGDLVMVFEPVTTAP